jgi:hypothetical protein
MQQAHERLLGDDAAVDLRRAAGLRAKSTAAIASEITAQLIQTRDFIAEQVRENECSIELMQESMNTCRIDVSGTSSVENIAAAELASDTRIPTARSSSMLILIRSSMIHQAISCSVVAKMTCRTSSLPRATRTSSARRLGIRIPRDDCRAAKVVGSDARIAFASVNLWVVLTRVSSDAGVRLLGCSSAVGAGSIASPGWTCFAPKFGDNWVELGMAEDVYLALYLGSYEQVRVAVHVGLTTRRAHFDHAGIVGIVILALCLFSVVAILDLEYRRRPRREPQLAPIQEGLQS